MANKVTGITDTTGALNIAPAMTKSVLLVGQVSGTPTATVKPNTVFSIIGTNDAGEKFGADSIMVKAVKVLIQNGVDTIYGAIVDSTVATDGTIANNYADALNASLGEASIKCIVIDNSDATVVAELKTHLAMAEAEDLFRYSVIAASAESDDKVIEFADSINDSRIFVVGPTFTDGIATVNPVLVSAGVTGAIMTETDDPALPMNGVVVHGIGNVNKTMLESTRNLYASNGVTALFNNGGSPTIHRLVTSYTTDAIWQEGTTRFIADYVLENIENTLRSNYQRTKNVARILDSIKTTVQGLLENFEALEIIEEFDPSTLTVVKDPTDMYGAVVDYEFDVVTPLYTITINQHMKL